MIRLRRGWDFDRYSGQQVAAAFGSTWAVCASFSAGGFDLLLLRWQVSYTRKPFRPSGGHW